MRILHLALLFVVLGVLSAAALDVPARGDHAMVATADPHATEAALAVLADGGTAADAIVTAALVVAVTEPYSSGLGGGGFVVGWQADTREAWTLDCRETAPAGADPGMYLDAGGVAVPDRSRTGALSVAVPGLVRGLWDLHQRHGRLPWRRLVEPARDLARDGFVVHEMLAQRTAYHHERGRFNQAMADVFCPGGKPVARGDRLRQADLAATLEAIAAHGPAPFYDGAIARRMADAVQAAGGILTAGDLAGYRAVWREPVRGAYRGREIIGMAPPSSGGVHIIQMLRMLEPYDLTALGYGSAAASHLLLETMKLSFADRSRFLGDPDQVEVPVDWLIGQERVDSLRARIMPDRALDSDDIEGAPRVPEGEHTTHMSVVDPAGNAAAATLTINLTFGSGMIAAGTGVILNDEMDDFAAAPGMPNAFGLVQGEQNAVAPGRRPLSSMSPTIVLQDDQVLMVTGSPGGSKIITGTLQSIIHVIDFGMDARQAVSVPRIHHQWLPDTAYVEWYGLSPDTRALLEARGHVITDRSPMGNLQAIVRDPETGVLQGASDPRGAGLAAGF